MARIALEKKAFDEKIRAEEEERRKAEIAAKEENYKNKLEFEKKAVDLAKTMAESGRADYEQQMRQKAELDYQKKKEAMLAEKANSAQSASEFKPTQYQVDLAKRYGEGITEESEELPNRLVKRVIVNRGGGNINMYSRVQWNWGGVYYFKNEQSTSKQIFDTETKW